MKTGIIYEWRNKLDGKFYVGQTINPESRYKDHLKAKGDSLFHRAIRLHGIENFEYTVVATYEHETEQGIYDLLNEAEVERIKFRNSLVPNGYNVSEGGYGGYSLSGYTQEQLEELADKKRKKMNEHYTDPKNRERQSQGTIKRFEDPNERDKTSAAVKKRNEEHPEILTKVADAVKKSWDDEEIRNKRIEGMRKAFETEEFKQKSGKSCRGKKPVNNGIVNKWIPKNEVDEFLTNNPGWVRGRRKSFITPEKEKERSKKISESKKGKHPYNNGKIEIRRRDDEEIPDGFVRGPLKKSA